MRKFFLTLSLLTISIASFAQEVVYVHDTVYIAQVVVKETVSTPVAKAGLPARNNWSAKLKASNFHLGLDLQTKYMWRGMEMIPEESAPVLFPCVNYSWNGLYVYAMGGYAFNGTIGSKGDEYFGGKHNGHWLEACITYTPERVPLWITASNFFAGDDDKYEDADGNLKQAYSTYLEIGTYYDFLNNNRISLAVGMTPTRSFYTNYEKKFAVCNIDLKYTYNVNFKNGWTLPLSAEYIYNPVFDKPYINFIANISF